MSQKRNRRSQKEITHAATLQYQDVRLVLASFCLIGSRLGLKILRIWIRTRTWHDAMDPEMMAQGILHRHEQSNALSSS